MNREQALDRGGMGWEPQPLQVDAQPTPVFRFGWIGCWVSRSPFNPIYVMSNVNRA